MLINKSAECITLLWFKKDIIIAKKLKLTTTKILQKGTTILIKISPLQGEKVYLQIISQKRLVTP